MKNRPTRLNPHVGDIMVMASTIAGGMMSACDPGQYTMDDERFIINTACEVAYGIAHKVLDDAVAAEMEEEACYDEYYRYVD